MHHFATIRRSRLAPLIRRYRYWLVSLVAVLALVLPNLSLGAQAQTAYPPFLDAHVNDYAQILEASDKAELRSLLSEFQAETGVQAVVLTVNSIRDYQTGDTTIESFATNLFNSWGIGDRTRNDGILMLVAVGDREMRIELGMGYSSRYDAVAQSVIDRHMIPYFRDGDFSRGIVTGARAVVSSFNPNAPPPTATSPSSRSYDSDGLEFVGEMIAENPDTAKAAGGGVAVLAIGVPILTVWNRHRTRVCPTCHTRMVRLDERTDDQYLNPGQKKEESLGSVDYDVWQCPSCNEELIKRYSSLLSQYGTCPACHYKTLKQHSRVVRHPTYTSTGRREIKETCTHCSHRGTRHETIPMKTRSSSSSGSSHGGGGRSSGGGASGKW